MTTDREMPLADFQAEMERRGKLDCKFVCPQCGNHASPNDFKRADSDPDKAPQMCIGRVKENEGCDWAAFGLLDICTVHILMEDGRRVPVFEFAETSG
jgi:hypothetical protein